MNSAAKKPLVPAHFGVFGRHLELGEGAVAGIWAHLGVTVPAAPLCSPDPGGRLTTPTSQACAHEEGR